MKILAAIFMYGRTNHNGLPCKSSSQANQSQLDAQLLEAKRKLATRDHELFTLQQKSKEAGGNTARGRSIGEISYTREIYVRVC
jgi:hypothetical protein